MMKNILKSLAVFCIVLLMSCGSSESSNNPGDQIDEALNSAQILDAEAWSGKLDQLLTLEIAATLMQKNAGDAQVEYQKVLTSPSSHSISYEWESDRIKVMEIPVVGKMEFPDTDRIELSWVSATTLDRFKSNYRTPTEEELQRANEMMQQKMKEMEKEGKITGQQSEAAAGLSEGLGLRISYSDVNGVGDYAVWNDVDQFLKVFYRGIEFQVKVNLGDEDKNKSVSIEAAKQIVSKL